MIIVYRHIREDTNKVFYIGIGTEKRAFDYISRSKEWKEVKSKTNIKAEIIFESETREQAFIKEREFIKLYGRADKLQGDLINKTDGGGWQKGIIWDATRREKYSRNAKKNKTLAASRRGRASKDRLGCRPNDWQFSSTGNACVFAVVVQLVKRMGHGCWCICIRLPRH